MSEKEKRNKKKRKKEADDDLIKEKDVKRPKYEEHSEGILEERNKKGKKRKDKKQNKTDKKDKSKRQKKHRKTDGKNDKSVINEDDGKEEKNKSYYSKKSAVRQPSDKTNEKNSISSKSKKNNGDKEKPIDKTDFFPLYFSKENSAEIYEMFSVCSWNNDNEISESFHVNGGSDNLSEKQAESVVGGKNLNVFEKTDLVSVDEINFPEANDMCYTFNSVSETKPSFHTVSYYEVVRNRTEDLSEVDEKSSSDLPSNIMETLNENFFTNIVAKAFSQTKECTSLFKETTHMEKDNLSFFPSLEEDDLSGKGPEMISDLEEEDSDEEVEDSEDLECSNLEMYETEPGQFDTREENESDNIAVDHKKDNGNREEQSQSSIERGAKEKLIEGTEVRESSKHSECFGEDECISKEENRRTKAHMKENECKSRDKLMSQKEYKQIEKELVEFKQLLKKLDGYISSVKIPKNFDDGDLFIATIEEVKSIYEKKKLTGSLSEVENSSYPELIIAIRKIFSVVIKKIYESDFPFCENSIQEGMANKMDIFLKCCDDYFLFFLKSIMSDSLACDNLFNTFIKHLKRNLSSFNKIHPFLLMVIFSNYPKSNCIMLCKFLNVCKIIFSVNFNYSYALPYLENLKRFLLFSMLEIYHNDDVNQIHYLFRKEAARYYSKIILKYYPKEQNNVISYLKRILGNPTSKFCSCYGALCAIRAMGSQVAAEVIPQIFPLVIMKIKSVKRFAKENLKIYSKIQSTSINQTTTSLLDEIQSEILELPQTQDAMQNKSVISQKKFDTLIPSENIYASLIREELLNACSQLTNKYVKNNLTSKKNSYLLSFTSNSVSSATVEMFLDYFGQELQQLIPLKYASKTLSQNSDVFKEKLIIDLKLRRKEKRLLY